ncbi:MAG: hypothetical protein AAFV53_02120 [Myxococcota bacterium]
MGEHEERTWEISGANTATVVQASNWVMALRRGFAALGLRLDRVNMDCQRLAQDCVVVNDRKREILYTVRAVACIQL